MVILSGGTSKGAGDLCYRAIASFNDPGIVVHGVALKPGKPLCLAVTGGKPIVILPGFPTSAIFTFHEFVAPVIRAFAGLPVEQAERLPATLPMRIVSERGRTEYLMVSLVRGDGAGPLAAYPNSKGSGAVTAFSQADGFITIGQHVESLPAGTPVEVQLIGRAHLADLVIIGSHCVGLGVLIGRLQAEGISVKALNVGSTGGLAAAKRGECDIAAIHLMDPETGEYNRPFLTPALELVSGYRRLQGIVYRKGDPRFEGRSIEDAISGATAGRIADGQPQRRQRHPHPDRSLTQRCKAARLLVTAEVTQCRWCRRRAKPSRLGIAIYTIARQYGLGFIPDRTSTTI